MKYLVLMRSHDTLKNISEVSGNVVTLYHRREILQHRNGRTRQFPHVLY